MEYYEKYFSRIEANSSPEMLETLHKEAMYSLENDPPEKALTLTGQMLSALLAVAQQQSPPERSIVYAINVLRVKMMDYLKALGWIQRAVKTSTGWRYEHLPM